jgi:hypothetical protein
VNPWVLERWPGLLFPPSCCTGDDVVPTVRVEVQPSEGWAPTDLPPLYSGLLANTLGCREVKCFLSGALAYKKCVEDEALSILGLSG